MIDNKVDLPASWTTATIGQLISDDGIFIDGDWVESKDQEPDGSVRLIQLADIGDGEFRDKSARFLTLETARELRCTFLKQGDILVARMPDPLGRCCIFPHDRMEGFVTVVDVCVVRTGSALIDNKFLMYALNSGGVRSKIADLQSGSTRKRISRGNLATIDIPLAPYNEQCRIVAKIETLFSELDKGVESLSMAREQLKAYRQAVLKHAFEGKLTAAWRKQNQKALKTPEILLSSIRVERENRHAEALKEWQKAVSLWQANGQKGRKPIKPTILDWPKNFNFGNLSPLPHGWCYVPFGGIADTIRNGISDKPNETGALKIFRISAVRPMTFDMSDFRRIDDDDEYCAYRLRRGDLVFTRYNGSRAFVGVAALYKSDDEFVYPDKLIRCEIGCALIDTGFLEKAVNCGESRKFIERRIRTTAGQAGISGGDLKSLPVAICNIEEQREIGLVLDAQLSQIAQLEADLDAALAAIAGLRHSVLKKAFSGKLVAQNPRDEHASVLLERIRAEREYSTIKQPRNNKNKKEAA
jgi:type I restriction enzyme S subunit